MKSIKMALLAGAAVAVSAAAAQAEDLDALKAQIESLNARVAAMETAPAVPAGYQLIAVSEGDMKSTPGLGMTARELAAYGDKSTVISVLPTADAPAGTTITWSGYARAGLVYTQQGGDVEVDFKNVGNDNFDASVSEDYGYNTDSDDVDVRARGQIRVTASTDTAVGEVGVDIRMRGNFNGNGNADVYSDVAWGYWAMTPEVTLGGGYAGSLGNIGYGYDGACSCYYTDNADLAFNPGDTTQMRLSYASGPFSMAVALEDASFGGDSVSGSQLGAAGEVKYSGDAMSGEISGVFRDVEENSAGIDSIWQIGAGVGFALGDMANLSLGAALGEGPYEVEDEGVVVDGAAINNNWWGVSALASLNVSDEVHFELGAGYKNRESDDWDNGVQSSDGVDYDTYGVLAGVYYQPVDQLTIGLEGEWYNTNVSYTVEDNDDDSVEVTVDQDNWSLDLVSVWRF